MPRPSLPSVGGMLNTWGPSLNSVLGDLQTTADRVDPGTTGVPGQVVRVKNDGTVGWGDMPFHNVKRYGAIGDGSLHPLLGFFGTLADAQDVYPFATALTQQIDSAAYRLMMEVTAPNIEHLAYTPPNYEGLGGLCFAESGQYMMDISVPVQTRQRLIGAGQADRWGGCNLWRIAGATQDLIVGGANGYDWHAGEIAHLGLFGNRRLAGAGSGGTTAGRGLVLNSIMETSEVHHVYSVANPSDGFYVTGGVPGTIRKCSSFHNGGWGFNMHAFGNAMLLDSPSGDMNDDGFIRIRGHSADGTSQLGSTNSITIINPKGERGDVVVNGWSTEATHDPAIVIDQFGGPVTIIGGTLTGHGEGSTEPEIGTVAVRRMANSEYATVIIENLVISHYVTEYEDLVDATKTKSTATAAGFTRTLNVNTSQPAAPLDRDVAWTNTSIAIGARLRQYVYFAGVEFGDFIMVSSSAMAAGDWSLDVDVVATDNVWVTATNHNAFAGPADLGTIYMRCWKR